MAAPPGDRDRPPAEEALPGPEALDLVMDRDPHVLVGIVSLESAAGGVESEDPRFFRGAYNEKGFAPSGDTLDRLRQLLGEAKVREELELEQLTFEKVSYVDGRGCLSAAFGRGLRLDVQALEAQAGNDRPPDWYTLERLDVDKLLLALWAAGANSKAAKSFAGSLNYIDVRYPHLDQEGMGVSVIKVRDAAASQLVRILEEGLLSQRGRL